MIFADPLKQTVIGKDLYKSPISKNKHVLYITVNADCSVVFVSMLIRCWYQYLPFNRFEVANFWMQSVEWYMPACREV